MSPVNLWLKPDSSQIEHDLGWSIYVTYRRGGATDFSSDYVSSQFRNRLHHYMRSYFAMLSHLLAGPVEQESPLRLWADNNRALLSSLSREQIIRVIGVANLFFWSGEMYKASVFNPAVYHWIGNAYAYDSSVPDWIKLSTSKLDWRPYFEQQHFLFTTEVERLFGASHCTPQNIAGWQELAIHFSGWNPPEDERQRLDSDLETRYAEFQPLYDGGQR